MSCINRKTPQEHQSESFITIQSQNILHKDNFGGIKPYLTDIIKKFLSQFFSYSSNLKSIFFFDESTLYLCPSRKCKKWKVYNFLLAS